MPPFLQFLFGRKSRKDKSPADPKMSSIKRAFSFNKRGVGDAPPPPYVPQQPYTQPGPAPFGEAPNNPFSDAGGSPFGDSYAPAPEQSFLRRATTFRQVPSTDPYAPLARFDTVFLIDDSGSMAGSNWAQTSAALAAIVPVCTTYDADGVDIYFLNHRGKYNGVRSAQQVMGIFSQVSPMGTTPTGLRLGELLRTYMAAFKLNRNIKPLNIICITDGEPTDPAKLERAIVDCAKELDTLDAKERQVGVQFFQVGSDEGATEALEELDNSLVEEHGVRDMVDTVSWKQMNGGHGLTGDGVLKAVMGAIDGKLDRKRKF
jgi:uncharacterized protein YegL